MCYITDVTACRYRNDHVLFYYYHQARGQADIRGGGGVAAAIEPQSRPVSAAARGEGGIPPVPSAQGRNVEESEYLQRLKQIRLQNFNERRALRDKQAG